MAQQLSVMPDYLAQWVTRVAPGVDVRLYNLDTLGVPYCEGWFFWNNKTKQHEMLHSYDLKDMGFTLREMNDLIAAMPKVLRTVSA